jgi:hypothetical protein
MAGVAGAAITGGFALAAKSYSQEVLASTKASRQYLALTQEINKNTLSIKGSMTTAVIPYMQLAAGLSEKAAKFANDHPEVVRSTLVTGGSLGALAGLSSVVSFVGKLGGKLSKGIGATVSSTSAWGTMNEDGGMAAGAYGPLTATQAARAGAVGTFGSILGGLFVGLAGNDLLARTKAGQNAGMQTTDKVATVGVYELWKVFGQTDEAAKKAAADFGTFIGAIKPVAPELAATTDQMRAYLGYLRQEEQAQRQYQIQTSRAQRDFNLRQTYEQEDNDRARMRAIRDFSIQEAQADKENYLQRQIAARDFGIQVARAEQDHKIQMKRMSEDHQWNMFQILRSGDAMAYLQEMHSYNLSKSRAGEDYNLQRSRANQDFGRQMQDKAREFAIQRQYAAQQFNLQMADQAVDYQVRRKREAEQFKIQMSDLNTNFEEERLQRKQAFSDQLADMYGATVQQENLVGSFAAYSVDALGKMTNAAKTFYDYVDKAPVPTASDGSRASGGYVGAGMYQMHPHEFVLNADTTHAFESLAAGNLTQDRVLGMLARSQSRGGKSVHIGSITFASGIRADEKADLQRWVVNTIKDAME